MQNVIGVDSTDANLRHATQETVRQEVDGGQASVEQEETTLGSMNSPRDTFRAKPGNISKLRDVVDSFIFTEAAVVASMQQVENQSSSTDRSIEAAAQNHWKLQGAREYLGILLGLCDPEPNQRKPRQSLDHNAG